jgi:hypothetical protein
MVELSREQFSVVFTTIMQLRNHFLPFQSVPRYSNVGYTRCGVQMVKGDAWRGANPA